MRLFFGIVISLMVLSPAIQGQQTGEVKMPAAFCGEWYDRQGRSEYNGMLIRPHYIEYFYQLCRYEKIEDHDSLCLVTAKMHDGRELSFTIRPLSEDSLEMMRPDGRKAVYERVEAPLIAKKQDPFSLPGLLKKKWYATRGNHPLVFEVNGDSLVYNGKKYHIEDLLYIEDKLRKEYRVVAVAPDDEMMFYFKKWQTEGYVQIGYYGFYGALYKSDPDYPDQRCENVAAILPAIRGIWYTTDGRARERFVIGGGEVLIDGEKETIIRISGDNPYHVELKNTDDKLHSLTLQKAGKEYLFFNLDESPRVLLKKDSAAADFIPATLPEGVQGEWFSTDGKEKRQLLLLPRKFILRRKKVREPVYGTVTEGLALFSKKGKKMRVITKQTDDHLEIVDHKGRRYLLKRAGVQSDSMMIDPRNLPEELRGMWYGTDGREYWAFDVRNRFLVADNAFWDYGNIRYRDGTYNIAVQKGPEKRSYTFCLKEYPYCEVSRNGSPGRRYTHDPAVAVRKPDNHFGSRNGWDVLVQGYLANDVEKFPSIMKLRYVSIVLDDDVTYTSRVDSMGRFSFSFPVAYGMNIYLESRGPLQYLFVFPGDSIMVRFTGEDMQFMGDDADACYDVQEYWEMENKVRENMTPHYLHDTLAEFRQYAEKKQEELKMRAERFLAGHEVSGNFRKWYEDRMKYNLPYLLLDYYLMHPLYKDYNMKEWFNAVPEDYFDFLESYPVNLKKDIVSGKFRSYVHNVFYYHDIKKRSLGGQKVNFKVSDLIGILKDAGVTVPEDITDALPDIGEGTAKDTNHLKKVVDFVNSNATLVQLFIGSETYKTYFNKIDQPDLYQIYLSRALTYSIRTDDTLSMQRIMSLFLSKIEYPGFRNVLLSKYRQVMEDARKPMVIDASLLTESGATTGDSLLLQIVNKHKGKVIYVDFWATWCGPCRGEMPASKKIREHFKGKDVAFVYLCSSSSGKGSWKRMIQELEIAGDNYYVKNSAWSELTGRFGITGIPHYILIDREGRVVDKDAPRPSHEKVLIPAIEGLLKTSRE